MAMLGKRWPLPQACKDPKLAKAYVAIP